MSSPGGDVDRFTSATGNFITNRVAKGDQLTITGGLNPGTYEVYFVYSETALDIKLAFGGGASGPDSWSIAGTEETIEVFTWSRAQAGDLGGVYLDFWGQRSVITSSGLFASEFLGSLAIRGTVRSQVNAVISMSSVCVIPAVCRG
jgi:hypothetical protein